MVPDGQRIRQEASRRDHQGAGPLRGRRGRKESPRASQKGRQAMSRVHTGIVALATFVVAGCGPDKGTVVDKTTEGLEVTGHHFLHCQRIEGKTVTVTKVEVGYDTYISTKIGDRC